MRSRVRDSFPAPDYAREGSRPHTGLPFSLQALAGWQSGHAAACKAVYAGSIPTSASRLLQPRTVSAAARVVKLVDTRDLKSLGASHAGSIPAPGTNVVTVESIQPATVLRIMWATHAVDLSAVLLRT